MDRDNIHNHHHDNLDDLDADVCSLASESEDNEQELPPLEDRKCFLTCLACILTSSYKYDVIEQDQVETMALATGAGGGANGEEDNDEKGDDDKQSNGSNSNRFDANAFSSDEELEMDVANSNRRNSKNKKKSKDNSSSDMFMEDDYEEEEDEDVRGQTAVDTTPEAKKITTTTTTAQANNSSQTTTSNTPRLERWRRRFGRGKSASTTTNDASSPAGAETKGEEEEEVSATPPTTMNNSSGNNLSNSNHSGSVRLEQPPPKQQRRKRVSKAQKQLQLVAMRHYRRRHVVADQFLQSSCEHLLLDPQISEEFYQELKPLLEPLKSPRIVVTNNTNNNPVFLTPVARIRIAKRWSSGGSGGNASGNGSGSGSDSDNENPENAAASDVAKDAATGDAATDTSATTTPTKKQDNNIDAATTTPTTNTTTQTPTSKKQESEADERDKQMQQQYLKQHEWMTEYDSELLDHLPGLNPGAGYRCLCWLLFQHLLHANKKGYDARARYAFKSLAVAVLVQDIERTLTFTGDRDDYLAWKIKNYTTWVSFATRKFEQVETSIAEQLLKLAEQKASAQQNNYEHGDGTHSPAVSLEDIEGAEDEVQVVSVTKNKKKLARARKHIVRGLKIGGVGVVAGTLLAVTGGMAAPAIAGALTFLGMASVAGTFLTLASTSAVVHIFGVAGGSLAAYKMRRRTAGLTEFKIVQSESTIAAKQQQHDSNDPSDSPNQQQTLPGEQEQAKAQQPRLARWKEKAKAFKNRNNNNNNSKQLPDSRHPQGRTGNPELSRTICISGWLTDKCDFQRPWGIQPTKPPPSKLEKLQRFYRIYNPDLIPVCSNLLKRWKNEMSTFWELLEDKYGCNPDTLFPLRFGPRHDAALSEMELFVLQRLILEIGEARGKKKQARHSNLPDHVQDAIASSSPTHPSNSFDHLDQATAAFNTDDRSIASVVSEEMSTTSEAKDEKMVGTPSPEHFQRQCYASVFEQVAPSSSLENLIPPAHLATVWDFSARYGGEVYSLHWETHMLFKLSECFKEVAMTTAATASRQAMQLMVANTVALMATVPIYLVQALNSIDETWSVVVSRAEEAGKELARSLLVNNAGHRPVTLLGYSFGARVVFSCLKQLLVYQQQWEEYHEQKNSRAMGFAHHDEEGKAPSKRDKKWMLEELEFDREPASVVEDVVLMGAPMYLNLSSWKACRQIVAGRFVNVYSRTDKILSLMFKYKQLMESFKPVCGNCTVAVPGVENIDISDMISNHQEYVLKLGDILKRVRHGQPIRSSSNALDEVALIAEAQRLVKKQEAEAAANKDKHKALDLP